MAQVSTTEDQDLRAADSVYSLQVLNKLEQLDAICEEWDELYLSVKYARPECSYAWISSWAETSVPEGVEWRVFTLRSQGSLVAVAPLVLHRRNTIFGQMVEAELPFDLQTRGVDILISPDTPNDALASLFDSMRDIIPRLAQVKIQTAVEGSKTLKFLSESERGWVGTVDLSARGSYMPVPTSDDTIRQQVSRNFRRNLTKGQNRFCRPDCSKRLVIESGADAGDHTWLFLEIEASGWKGEEGTAILNDPTTKRFYECLTQRLANRDWLEYHFLEMPDSPASAHMAIRVGERIFLPKIAYNEACAYCSPGNTLFLKLLEHLRSEGVIKEVDCLTDMPWHRNWRMPQRKYFEIRIIPKSFLPMLLEYWPVRLKLLLRGVPGVKYLKRAIHRNK